MTDAGHIVRRVSASFVDVFAGAGGLSLGFTAAGFNLVGGFDFNEAAVATHAVNFCEGHEPPTPVDVGDESFSLPPADVVVGGPPCQGFSSAGARRKGDKRNNLVRRYADLIVRARPAAFVFENVEGFLTFDSGDYVFDLLEPLVDAGYRVHLRKINAANFGVPQHRKRVVAIGGRGWDPSFPDATHWAYGAPGAHVVGSGLARTPTLAQAIVGLPPATPEPPGAVPDHFYRPLTGVDLERAQALLPGQRMRDLPEHLWHESYRRRANRRVADGTPSEKRGGAPAGIRRLRSDEPCKAITGGARNEFIHPTEDRALTLRECARIQTFPDHFEFRGTQTQQMQLIGNAVPPLLARAIAESLAADLSTVGTAPTHADGALLTFVPTLAEGMSPALADVVDRVVRAFAPESVERAA